MIKKLLSTYLLCILYISTVQGVIFEVNDLSKFKEEATKLDTCSLVLFDVDYTLLTPKDASLKPCGKALRRQYLFVLDPRRREWLQSIMALEGEEVLMNREFPPLIQQMQKNRIPVIGLTALETGKYGKIVNSEDWRINQLRKFDIDFTSTVCDKENIIFCESTPHNGHYPIFKNGILFTNRLPKGEVLIAFLEKIDWKPNKILFMDDSIDQLKSVESAANTLDVEFIGFHYIAAETNPCEFNQALGEFQFQNLVENEQWLPDAEAKKALKQRGDIK